MLSPLARIAVLAAAVLASCAAAKPLTFSLAAGGDPCGPAAAAVDGLEPGTDYTFQIPDLIVRNKAREYLMHVPATFKSQRANALIVGLHGMGDTPANFARVGLNKLADADDRGVILVYPKGSASSIDPTGYTWNGGDCCFSTSDDVEFIRKVVADVSARVCVDSSKVFAFGFSAGAVLSHRLAIEANPMFRAIASMSGPLLVKPPSQPLATPVSLLYFHGTADVLFPYSGANPLFHGARYTFKNWGKLNACSSTTEVVFANGTVTGEGYKGCASGSSVALYTVKGMAHEWPRGDVDATSAVYGFFRSL